MERIEGKWPAPGSTVCKMHTKMSLLKFIEFHPFIKEATLTNTEKKKNESSSVDWGHETLSTRWVAAKVDTVSYAMIYHTSRRWWAKCWVGTAIHFQHLIAVPMDMNVPNVPPPCSITLPTLWISSRPLRPYLRAEKPPKSAPDAMPTQKPIVKPIFTRSQQLGPRW